MINSLSVRLNTDREAHYLHRPQGATWERRCDTVYNINNTYISIIPSNYINKNIRN